MPTANPTCCQGAGSTILFEIDAVDVYDACESVEATVLGSPCSGSPHIGDAVTIYDEAGCFFNEPPDMLVGRVGFAAKLEVEIDGYETECRWVVHSLCCAEPL